MVNTTCPIPAGAAELGDKGTSWMPMVLVGLASAIVTTAISLTLIILHLRRYRSPKEQRQIIRIIFSLVVYSFVAFLEIYDYRIAQQIDPVGDLYEAFGLCALYLLFIQYAAPSGTFDEETFETMKAAGDKQATFDWPKLTWVFVFQYPIVLSFCFVILEITAATGRYCTQSLSPVFFHLWYEIFQSISIGFCVVSIIKFWGNMKQRMKAHRGLPKIVAFKVIVFVRYFQSLVFSLLLQHNVIKPSKMLTYNDIMYGLPGVLSCAEMVLFAVGFWYAFSSSEYGSSRNGQRPLSLGRACLDALNPTDLIKGMYRVFPLFLEESRNGDFKRWRASQAKQGLSGLILKGIEKYKGRKGQTNEPRYQELNEDLETLNKPNESHHVRSGSAVSEQQPNYYPEAEPRGSDVYQPPQGSPPIDESAYLGAQGIHSGRARSPSQGYLMTEYDPQPTRSRSPSGGHWNGQRYEASSPSPSENRVELSTSRQDFV